ncbi:MAG: sterol desaturase family protein [Gammaproteobacteria bacterium]
MKPEDLIPLMIPLTWLGMVAVEALGTGRRWPAVALWRAKGAVFFVMLMALNAGLPALIPAWLSAYHVFDGVRLGTAGGVVVGFLILSLGNAVVHRAYHRFDVLWRWIHQLHHAPHRIDAVGAVIFTPWEVVMSIAVFQVLIVFVLGLDPLAAALVGYIAAFYGLFQHFNIRTPQWLGYWIQRPESHCVHHRRGFHAYNYADLPLWDMLWGTFRNPKDYLGEVGFEGAAATRMTPMLIGRDVNQSLYGAYNRGRSDPAGNPA